MEANFRCWFCTGCFGRFCLRCSRYWCGRSRFCRHLIDRVVLCRTRYLWYRQRTCWLCKLCHLCSRCFSCILPLCMRRCYKSGRCHNLWWRCRPCICWLCRLARWCSRCFSCIHLFGKSPGGRGFRCCNRCVLYRLRTCWPYRLFRRCSRCFGCILPADTCLVGRCGRWGIGCLWCMSGRCRCRRFCHQNSRRWFCMSHRVGRGLVYKRETPGIRMCPGSWYRSLVYRLFRLCNLRWCCKTARLSGICCPGKVGWPGSLSRLCIRRIGCLCSVVVGGSHRRWRNLIGSDRYGRFVLLGRRVCRRNPDSAV